jgi:hypothetical protein
MPANKLERLAQKVGADGTLQVQQRGGLGVLVSV